MPNSKITIIDGGVGTEISRRGLPLHPSYWSAAAHMTHPDTMLQIHIDFINAGADIISANTFMAGRHILAAGGLKDFEVINKKAIQLAKTARTESGNENLQVAGTLSTLPPLDQADDISRGKQIEINYRDQASLLAESGADILLVEMLFDSESAASLLSACCDTGLPVWAGVSATTIPNTEALMTFRQQGKLEKLPHETFDSLIKTVVDFPVAALGVMHTEVKLMPSALNTLKKRWQGRTLAYAKTGLATNHDWEFERVIDADEYSEIMSDWVDTYGLDIIGGCCGMSPALIDALSKRIHNR